MVKDTERLYFADNFERLYKCPIYVGNQVVYLFKHEGKQYELAFENPIGINSKEYISSVKKIIAEVIAENGEPPYNHYSFIVMRDDMSLESLLPDFTKFFSVNESQSDYGLKP